MRIFSLKSNSLEFLAPPFVSRQKVEKKNVSQIRLMKTPIEFTELELQTTVNTNYQSSMDLQFV